MYKHKNIPEDVRYRAVATARLRWSCLFALLVVLAYFTLILFIAFAPEVLGKTLSGEGHVTTGVLAGTGVIVLSVLLTGAYDFVSSRTLDKKCAQLRREFFAPQRPSS